MVNPKPLKTNGFFRSELRVRDSLLRNPLLLQGLFPVGHLDKRRALMNAWADW